MQKLNILNSTNYLFVCMLLFFVIHTHITYIYIYMQEQELNVSYGKNVMFIKCMFLVFVDEK